VIKFNFKISQKRQPPVQKQVDERSNWIVLLPVSAPRRKRETFPYHELLSARRSRLTKKEQDSDPLVTDLPNDRGSRVAFACVHPDISSFELLTLARKLVAAHDTGNCPEISLYVGGFSEKQRQRLAEAVVAAAASASVAMPGFKSRKDDRVRPGRLEIFGLVQSTGFRRTLAEAEGNALARYLSILPPNRLTPAIYLQQIKSLSRENGWKLEFSDISALKKKKAGAFLAVVQGSAAQDAGIARLRYLPARSARKGKLALVGKGICYDTGGTNLKPARFMFGMHEDMQGSAVALGTFLALTRLKVPFPVDCWLALASNHIGPKAYKPNDVVFAADGTAIEVVHTDAEGRMVLADTLLFASGQEPALIIDYATLTGACIYSVGTAYSGVFTNRDEFIPKLVKAGRESGERVWPFPLDEDYDVSLKSDVADVRQCALEGNADHILAARFLKRFIRQDVPWVHVDLSSSNHKGGLAHIPTNTTGFGVRYTLNLVLDNRIIQSRGG